jgi:hypothetical protein
VLEHAHGGYSNGNPAARCAIRQWCVNLPGLKYNTNGHRYRYGFLV